MVFPFLWAVMFGFRDFGGFVVLWFWGLFAFGFWVAGFGSLLVLLAFGML